MDFEPHFTFPERPDLSKFPWRPIVEWYQDLKLATSYAGRPIEYDSNTTQEMRQAGFVDIQDTVYKVPFDRILQKETLQGKYWKLARYYNEFIRESLDAWSVAPLTRVLPQKYTIEEWRRRLEVLEQAFKSDQLYGYHTL